MTETTLSTTSPDFERLVRAIYGQESGAGKNPSTSSAGARGGMQIMPATFQQYALPDERIDNPADNMRVGRRILADLWQRSGGDPARTAVGYFSGPGNMAPPGSATPYRRDAGDTDRTRTSSYVSSVLKRMGAPTVATASRPASTTVTTAASTPAPATVDLGSGYVVPANANTGPTTAQQVQMPPQNLWEAIGMVGDKLNQPKLDKDGKEIPNSSPMSKIAQGLNAQPQQGAGGGGASMPAPAMAPPQEDTYGPSAQAMAAITQEAQQPLQWSNRPYGYNAGPQAGPQGTTLNSLPPFALYRQVYGNG